MKRSLKLLLLVVLSCAIFLQVLPFGFASAGVGDAVNYTANFSSGLPSDWELYNKCDTADTSSPVNTTDGVKLQNTMANSVEADQYYGSVYKVATSIGNVSDFTLQITYRMLDYADTGRWLGVCYHTQYNDSGYMSGYMMNYRASGKSAQSTITTAPSFTDSNVVENAGAAHNKSTYHTIKITMSGYIATHYMDGQQIISYSIKDKASLLDGTQIEGGFAIIVNRSIIEIKSLTISGTQGNEQPTKEIDALGLVAAPIAVLDVTSLDVLETLTNTEKFPENVILHCDEYLDVLDSTGEPIDMLTNVYNDYVKNKSLLIVYVETVEAADAFGDWLTTSGLTDIAIMSNDPVIVEEFRISKAYIRGIIDWSNESVKTNNDYQMVLENTNMSRANVAVLSQAQATNEAVSYLQERMKTVWVKSQGTEIIDNLAIISTGAYGIISENASTTYSAIALYGEEKLAQVRKPLNIAHRGLCLSNYENSLEAYIQAYQNGATHIEIDVQFTSDNQLVVMHDSTLNRTTNYTGSKAISEMTLAEVQQYKIIKTYEGVQLGGSVNIPDIDDVFSYFNDKNIIFAFEFKTTNAQAVQVLKQKLNQYTMYNQIFVIAFSTAQLEVMRNVIPQVPTALLDGYGIFDDASTTDNLELTQSGLQTLCRLNTSIDAGYSGYRDAKSTYDLAKHGYMAFYWTFSKQTNIDYAYKIGTYGITNNEADKIKNYATNLYVNDEVITDGNYILVDDIDSIENEGINLYYKTFLGTTSGELDAVEFYSAKQEDLWKDVIYKYTYTSNTGLTYTLYTNAIRIVNYDKYLSVEEINDWLAIMESKTQLTTKEKEKLTAVNLAYNILTISDKDLVNVDIMDQLNDINNEPNNGGSGKGGCGMFMQAECLGISLLLTSMALFIVAKKCCKR